MDSESLHQIWDTLNELTQDISFNNITADTKFSPTTEEGVPIRKLFVGNLAERTTNKDLQKLFSNYGKVDSCYIKRNHNKNSFGFVTFNDVHDAVKARKAAHKMEIQLHCRILRVSAADSWHQPDSVENQRRFSVFKDNNSDNLMTLEELTDQPISNFDSPINVLNDDCLIEIFLYLPIADRIRMERVCKRWQTLSQESWRAVKTIGLSKNTWGLSSKIRIQVVDTYTLRKVLSRCGQFLTHLDLSQFPHMLSSSTLTIVGKFCPNLQHINVTALELSPSGITSLMTNCQNINKLMIKSLNGPCEKDLSQLFAVNKKLKYFAIEGDNHISGKCLGYLPSNIIEEVHLKYCPSLESSYLDTAIDQFTYLQSLTLQSCVCLIDPTLIAIGERKSIVNLEFSGNHPLISVDSMNCIANLINIQRLSLHENLAVTDDLLINISNNCKQLNYLNVSYCGAVSNKGISSLASLSKLEHLEMSFLNQVTDEALSDLHNLKVLKCWGCKKIKDPGIMHLISVANNLTSLDLSSCCITNKTLELAATVTKKRTNVTILKIIVGGNELNISALSEVSPFLQIVNVDLSASDSNSGTRNFLNFPVTPSFNILNYIY